MIDRRSFPCALAIALALVCSSLAHAGLPHVAPEEAGLDGKHLSRIDEAIQEALEQKRMPGCVVCIGRRGKIAFLRAYGAKQVEPEEVPMSADTVFDLASLTKPIATATSVMILVERGKVRLNEKVAAYLPEFGNNGKEEITVHQLLTHQSGLIADNPLSDYRDGPEKAWERIYALRLTAEPGARFIYSDVNFLVLADLVRRVSGKDVHEFSQENIFRPLGMSETGFLPGDALRARAAPTEKRNDQWMQGEVHDPRAYLLGGVAGHAGLFSTAEDLAIYASMMAARGRFRGTSVLGNATWSEMTRRHEVPRGVRGLGWDKRTGYSSNRGELLSEAAFGHGGFTGTAIWIDPELDLFVIFLSNRVHPNGKGLVNPLAGRIGTIAAAAIRQSAEQPSLDVLTGIDVLVRDKFEPLAGRKIGLITNHTGIDREGVSTVERFHQAENVQLVALFSPEHGFEGKLDVSKIGDARDEGRDLPIYSLYGETRRPTPEMLQGMDTLVFDIQDIGARYYTYVSTMGEAMRSAAEHKLRFVVLDRPNPIGGVAVEGPVLDPGKESFVGFHPLPIRHGMTAGELAAMFNDELRLELDLQVIPVENWRRGDYFDATGLLWINPSPNMRSLNQALLYPGIGLWKRRISPSAAGPTRLLKSSAPRGWTACSSPGN
jgi:CubicO group peptidase (beta-lactamase class C family)